MTEKDIKTPAPQSHALPVELDGISRALANEDGSWKSCSGCHELDEGVPTGPYSTVMKCHLGMGCGECGGIGAIWDATDYEEMGRFIASDTSTDDLTDCFRHHITTTIGWLSFGARPGPEMQMYEEGFKAGYLRCQSDNESELGEEEDRLSARARALVGRLRESIKVGAVQLGDVEDAIDLIIDQSKLKDEARTPTTWVVEFECDPEDGDDDRASFMFARRDEFEAFCKAISPRVTSIFERTCVTAEDAISRASPSPQHREDV